MSALFGVSVAVDNGTAVVGALPSNHPGAAYVFTRDGSVWTQQARLAAPGAVDADGFGVAVDLALDRVVAGAWMADVGDNVDQGAAYVFGRSGTSWNLDETLVATDGTSDPLLGGDHFGRALATDDGLVVVTAVGDDLTDDVDPETGIDEGSAYVYDLLIPTGEIMGTVTDVHGAPLAEAQVRIESAGVSRTTHTDDDGRYRFTLPSRSDEASGRYDVTASKFGYASGTSHVVLHENVTSRRDFRLNTATPKSVSGTVLDDAGEPIANALCDHRGHTDRTRRHPRRWHLLVPGRTEGQLRVHLLGRRVLCERGRGRRRHRAHQRRCRPDAV